MSIKSEIQKLEPGALIELFELDATQLGGDHDRWHAHTQCEEIVWQGNTYYPWPAETEGFDRNGDKPPTPKIRVGNIGGAISALCAQFDDLVGAKVVRRRTLAKFLDAVNFPDGNPTADPWEEMPPEVWFIERKPAETSDVVEFELASALDFNGVQLPRRQIIANVCPSGYRSAECGYAGPPVADVNDAPTTNPILDRCGKRMASCRLRFGSNEPLPFGGFPAAALIRT